MPKKSDLSAAERAQCVIRLPSKEKPPADLNQAS